MVFASLILTIGSVAFPLLVASRQPPDLRTAPLLTLPSASGAWACLVLVAVAPARLFLQARGLVEAGDPVWPMAANVVGTTWGRAWGVQTAGAVMALRGFRLARQDRNGGRQLAFAGTLALIGAAPFMGHAAGSDRLLWLSVGNDLVHLTSVGVWVGTLGVLTLAAASVRGGDAIAALIASFHPVALRSAALVLASGIVALLLRVPHWGSLVGSAYGNMFLVKAGAVLTVGAFGAFHARTGAHRAKGGGSSGVVRSLAAEAAFAAVTILATAVLVGTDPPDAT